MPMTDIHIGPIDCMVVEFPGSRFRGEIAAQLLDLVDRDVITILDLLVIRKDHDGGVVAVELSEVPDDEVADLGALDCLLPGLLTTDDIAGVGAALAPGTTAGLLVWENRWAGPLTTAVAEAGGEVVAGGRIDVAALHASLLAADAALEEVLSTDPQGAS
jgi:hypothetical protein